MKVPVLHFLLYVCHHMVHYCLSTWLVCKWIVTDVGDMPQCFILDILGHQLLHPFLHEGQ
jgi:hypothetical protein